MARRRCTGLVWKVSVPLALALLVVAMPFAAQSPGPIPDGFTRIFNGKDLTGWHPSRTAHHGKTPQLTVKDGAVYILQHPFGQGGVLMTNKKYGDFEFYVETDLKPGFNSGIFLRSTEEGAAYQVELDANAGNGALLGESLRISQGARPTRMAEVWKPNGWNSFRIRMQGAAPRITLWVNGEQMWDVQEPKNDMIAGMTEGFIGLQFHFLTSTGPSTMVMPLSYNTPGVPLGFRNMAIREIKPGGQLPPAAAATAAVRRRRQLPAGRGGACRRRRQAAPRRRCRRRLRRDRPTTPTASACSSCLRQDRQDDRGTLQPESDCPARGESPGRRRQAVQRVRRQTRRPQTAARTRRRPTPDVDPRAVCEPRRGCGRKRSSPASP